MDDKYYIDIAYKEALKAFCKNEVPVGAIIVKDNKILAKAHNLKDSTKNVFNHAEILAIRKACTKINDWRLYDCVMYVTLEPCPMCASAIQQSRISKIVYSAESRFLNTDKIVKDIFNNNEMNNRVQFQIELDERCSKILVDFFNNRR